MGTETNRYQDIESREFIEEFCLQLAKLEQQEYRYTWIQDRRHAHVAKVQVAIWGSTADTIIAGCDYVAPAAEIHWQSHKTLLGDFPSSYEAGQPTVLGTLSRAHYLRVLMGYEVVPVIETGA